MALRQLAAGLGREGAARNGCPKRGTHCSRVIIFVVLSSGQQQHAGHPSERWKRVSGCARLCGMDKLAMSCDRPMRNNACMDSLEHYVQTM